MTDAPKKLAFADRTALANVVGLGTRRSLWFYSTTEHDLRDVLRPDYFKSAAMDFGIRDRDIMDVVVGDAVEGIHLRLAIDWPVRLGPLCVALISKSKATPVRHAATEEAA